MGNCVSRFQLFQSTSEGHSEKRGITSELPPCPAFPIQEPTQSFWAFPPSSIATHSSSDSFPTHADVGEYLCLGMLYSCSIRRHLVVIIGSGISGASFARTLLDIDQERNDNSDSLNVVMLEAQDTCSGATGRNGGHINPPLYHDYENLKRSLGKAAAQQVMRFRLAHLEVLPEVAEAEADDADCREVHSVDVFFDTRVFAEAKRKLSVYKTDMPQEASTFHIWEGEDARRRYNLSSLSVGCITTLAGAVHPYRFVTDILLRLLEEYPKYFQLFTRTPCMSITEPSSTNPFYSLTTPLGQLTASHVVHLTNAYVGALVPGLADVVYRVRETMSAQRPGRALQFPAIGNSDVRKNHGRRSYVFYDSPEQKGFDYLTQLPDGEHELMFGGGREALLDTDGKNGEGRSLSILEPAIGELRGSPPLNLPWAMTLTGIFGVHGPAGRVKALWSGVLSVSVDEFPWTPSDTQDAHPDEDGRQGLTKLTIVALSPYTKQIGLLKSALPSSVTCSTIDAFQGRESDVVVFSTVRCNVTREIGFVDDLRRLNVMWTRAKLGLIIVGDRATMTEMDVLWRRAIESCTEVMLPPVAE
ncbi:hypothetical protein J3R83DRAFT_7140 [Lanmaoa asiatica]|nr:hypothetical protein J3R83DRAFT_7140 [Lanmaoa asiatica]